MRREPAKSHQGCRAMRITKDPPIAEGFEGPYDVIMSILCIENGCLTKDEYKAAVRRIVSLTKKGENFLLYTSV